MTPTFVVRIVGAPGLGKTSLTAALLDFPMAADEELARLDVREGGEDEAATPDAWVHVVRGPPGEAPPTLVHPGKIGVFVAVHARDLRDNEDDEVKDAWSKLLPPHRVCLTATPPAPGAQRGIDELRAALLAAALEGVDASVERVRRAKRPFAAGIIASAALASAMEGLLPGAAAFVVATQVGALSSLYYLYTGKWLGRTQALALLPVFAGEAAGGSVFLLVKSFLPPTGVADVAAAAIAASITLAMLGAVAGALEHGSSLDQKKELKLAFRRLRAKTRAERAEIARNRHRWSDRGFWRDLTTRLIFE